VGKFWNFVVLKIHRDVMLLRNAAADSAKSSDQFQMLKSGGMQLVGQIVDRLDQFLGAAPQAGKLSVLEGKSRW
jgi:hypothetical protein